MLGRRRTCYPSLYDSVFSSCRRRPHSQNTSEQAEGTGWMETYAVPFALLLQDEGLAEVYGPPTASPPGEAHVGFGPW
jgi:hypothetical protein